MYYCRNCKKVVKEGNKCSCGNELTRKDEIIYCPTCNKMYFKPTKSFTCKKCNSYVKVEPDAVVKQNEGQSFSQASNLNGGALNGNAPQSNSAYASMFLNESGGGDESSKIVQKEGNKVENFSAGLNSASLQKNETNNSAPQSDFWTKKVEEYESKDKENNNFQHKGVESQASENALSNQSQKEESRKVQKKVKSVDDDFDTSLFENAEEESSKKGGRVKGKKADKKGGDVKAENAQGSPSKVTLLAIALIFVCAVVLVFYVFILPHLTPTYKQNWEKFISAENAKYDAYGIDKSVSTASFDVENEGNDVVIAIIKVDEKTYNEETEKYESVMKTFKVEFVKKADNFVIKTITEVTE